MYTYIPFVIQSSSIIYTFAERIRYFLKLQHCTSGWMEEAESTLAMVSLIPDMSGSETDWL